MIEVPPDYPFRSAPGVKPDAVDPDAAARAWAFLHFQQAHGYRVFTAEEGGRVCRIDCECGRSWPETTGPGGEIG